MGPSSPCRKSPEAAAPLALTAADEPLTDACGAAAVWEAGLARGEAEVMVAVAAGAVAAAAAAVVGRALGGRMRPEDVRGAGPADAPLRMRAAMGLMGADEDEGEAPELLGELLLGSGERPAWARVAMVGARGASTNGHGPVGPAARRCAEAPFTAWRILAVELGERALGWLKSASRPPSDSFLRQKVAL